MTFRSFHLRRKRAFEQKAHLQRKYGLETGVSRRFGVWIVAVELPSLTPA